MLDLDRETRNLLWQRLGEVIEGYWRDVPKLRAAPRLDRDALRALLARLDFQTPLQPLEALELAAAGLREHQVHTPHPRYFGLFNPAPTAMGIVADALVAAFNPQMAAWSHSPLAAEIELHLARAFGARFGWDPATTDGVFASGGAEANHTAVLTALVHAFPGFAEQGVRSLPRAPVLYASSEAHHSLLKAARLCGLGTAAVRAIPADAALKLDVAALERQIATDRAAGLDPFFVVATLGTTSAGVLDPISAIAELARREHLWLHADAAWGGAVVIVPEMQALLAGIERADSITVDAHKWLSVPMGAGLYLTRHPQILERTFRVTAGYMPKDAAGMPVVDPYAHSMQWSRRFIGLKVFLSLAVAGWDGYADVIRYMTAMGERLRERLTAARWRVVNETPLPIACFVDATSPEGDTMPHLEGIVRDVLGSGHAWISTVRLADRQPALRACITNYRTGLEDLDVLVAALGEARRQRSSGRA
jgi:glutamate/tyrosine decarboxylase-like PLP-dependent enzyme